MPRKFSWFIFFIIVSITASVCFLFIPYPVSKVIDGGYSSGSGHGLSQSNSYYTTNRNNMEFHNFSTLTLYRINYSCYYYNHNRQKKTKQKRIKGLFTIADLSKKVINHKNYEILWYKRCAKLKNKLNNPYHLDKNLYASKV